MTKANESKRPDTEIRVLPPELADKIAAGEVAERPASVVKELVENAIDAGADSITVEIKNGGVTYIRVADNGSGIPPEYVETAFLRHATSKLHSIDELYRIGTMGFRGEALSSIAAVAKVEVITKTAGSDEGVYYCVDHGKVMPKEDIACSEGTTMLVGGLFENVPARMKFLKKDSTEAGYVTDLMNRIALSKPEISFKYISDGKEIFTTSGDGELRNAILNIYGLDHAKAVIPVEYLEDGIEVKGVVGKPEISRGNRARQTLFVNGRYIKSHVVGKVVEEAYRNNIMVGRFPFFVLDIRLPLELVDVNVHPAKTEIKFANEKKVYDVTYRAVRNALYNSEQNDGADAKSADAEPTKSSGVKPRVFAERTASSNVITTKTADVDRSKKLSPQIVRDYLEYTKPVVSVENRDIIESGGDIESGEAEASKPAAPGAGDVFESGARSDVNYINDYDPNTEYRQDRMDIPLSGAEDRGEDISRDVSFRVAGQIFDTYILVESGDSFYIIDQHAAHERFRFEKLKKDYLSGERMSQVLMKPVVVNLTPIEFDAVIKNLKQFEKFGFKIEEFGGNSAIVRETPIIADEKTIESLVIELADAFSQNIRRPIADFEEKALDMISCKYAIKANKKLSELEMTDLVEKVFALEKDGIKTCPHGRPIKIEYSKKDIEKLFKRIV